MQQPRHVTEQPTGRGPFLSQIQFPKAIALPALYHPTPPTHTHAHTPRATDSLGQLSITKGHGFDGALTELTLVRRWQKVQEEGCV